MTAIPIYWAFCLAAAIWVFTDDRRMLEQGYDFDNHAWSDALLTLLFLPVYLPWHLACRSASLREGPIPEVPESGTR